MNEFVQITRLSRIPEEEFYPVINRMYEHIWRQLLPPQLVTDGLSNRTKNNVVTPADAPIPDCLTCGACCQSWLCVGVRPSDNVSSEYCWDITAEGDDETIVVDRYLKRNGETLACAALEGNIGERVACTIYETRPAMCRHFEAGSDRCHAIRRAFGIEPFLSLDEMSDAMEKLGSRPVPTEPAKVIRNARIRPNNESDKYEIAALMENGELREIHRYDPERETWLQFEFDGLSLEEAEALIHSRETSINTSQDTGNAR
jgi:Fe-S-cluster containining protein